MRHEVQLQGGPTAAGFARAAVDGFSSHLPTALQAALAEDVKLLVSELVTNSVRHGGAGELDHVDLQLSFDGSCVRVEVGDSGPGFVPRTTPAPRPDLIGGFGLVLVERLTHRWGVDREGSSRVWFEIEAPKPPARVRRSRARVAPVPMSA